MMKFKELYTCDSITINVTNACNLACSYCFEHDKNNTYMNEETAIKILEESYIKTDRSNGVFTINLFGGEPFLNWDVIKKMVDHCNKNNYSVKFGVTTNLTILTDEMIKYIDDNDIMLLISIDGIKEVHDRNRCNSYDVVEANIKRLAAAGLNHLMEGRITVLPVDVPHLLDGIKNVISLGINNICPMQVTDTSWKDAYYILLHIEYKKIVNYYLEILNNAENKRNLTIRKIDEILINALEPLVADTMLCPIGNTHWCSFDTNGDIYPCHQCPTSDKPDVKNMIIGNIFTEVDENKVNIYDKFTDFNKDMCKDCDAKIICKSGCPIQNFSETGDFSLPTSSYCEVTNVLLKVVNEARDEILKSTNIRSRLLNVLKENLKLKEYFDTEILHTDITSLDMEVKIIHFQEMCQNLEKNILPSFETYFYESYKNLLVFITSERGMVYGEQGTSTIQGTE